MEVVVRALIMFTIVFVLVRAVGKRELGQLSTFELVLLIAVGDLVQQSVTQEDYSLVGGTLAISTFGLLTIALSYVSWRFPRVRKVIDGIPTLVVDNGAPRADVMTYERLPIDELHEAARAQGIRNLSEVQLAVFEPNGTFTFFRKGDTGEDGGSTDRPSS